MTVAKMHKQRQVKRGKDKPRYTRQKQIKRGGRPASGGGGGGLTLTSVTPNSIAVGAEPLLNFVGTGFDLATKLEWSGLFGFPAEVVGFIVDSPTAARLSGASVTTNGINNEAGVSDFVVKEGATTSAHIPFTVTAAEDPEVFLAQNHTIAETEAWVDEHPEFADEALSWEQGHQDRVTLVNWLQGFISDRDEGHIP